MKKLRTALLVSAALMATNSKAQWQGNWLIGISGSYNWIDHADGDEDNNAGFLINGITETDFAIGEQHQNAWGWGILGGYQARCNGWLLGAEVAVDWIGSNKDDNSFTFQSSSPRRGWIGNASFSRDFILALTGRLGYEAYYCILPYVRAGIETSRQSVSFLISTSDGVLPYITATGDSYVQSTRFIGGIGVEVPLPFLCGLSARGEWDFHSNGKSVDATVLASDNATLIFVGGKQEINTAKLSIVYNFPA